VAGRPAGLRLASGQLGCWPCPAGRPARATPTAGPVLDGSNIPPCAAMSTPAQPRRMA